MTQLQPKKLALQYPGYEFNTWVIHTEHGMPAEALLDPAYWAHVSGRLRRKDVIIAFADDGSYKAELLVLDSGLLFVKVMMTSKVMMETRAPGSIDAIPDGYAVKWSGESDQWCVLRGKDKLHQGEITELKARDWLATHVRGLMINQATKPAAPPTPPPSTAKAPTKETAETL